ASRHTLVTLAQRPATLSVLANGAGSRSTDGVSQCCPKERTASPETDPVRPDAGHRERTRSGRGTAGQPDKVLRTIRAAGTRRAARRAALQARAGNTPGASRVSDYTVAGNSFSGSGKVSTTSSSSLTSMLTRPPLASL